MKEFNLTLTEEEMDIVMESLFLVEMDDATFEEAKKKINTLWRKLQKIQHT